MANTDRMTIYMNDQDKANIEKLMTELDNQGIDWRGRGDKSISNLIRYLTTDKLKKLTDGSTK